MRRAAFLGAALTVVAAVLFVETTLAPLLYWVTPPVNRDYAESLRDKRVAAGTESYDVLFFGDSTAREGIIPAVFTQATGRQSYSLALNASINAWTDIFLLDHYLESHSAPRAVIVAQSFATYAGTSPLAYDAVREDFPDFRLSWLLFRAGLLWPARMGDAALAMILPSYRYGPHVRRALIRFALLGDRGFQLADDGSRGYDRMATVAANADLYEHTAPGWVMHPEHRLLLDELCRLADRRKVTVFLTISPHVTADRFDEASARVLRSAQDLLSEMSRTHPYCHVLEGDRAYHWPQFSDHTHLNASGALVFTAELAREYLATGTGAGRSD